MLGFMVHIPHFISFFIPLLLLQEIESTMEIFFLQGLRVGSGIDTSLFGCSGTMNPGMLANISLLLIPCES